MHVITKKRLVEFTTVHADALEPLKAWYSIAKAARWLSIADVRSMYPHADYVAPFTVFNIKGNTYRLIAIINYRAGRSYIKHILTHADYDEREWKQ